MGADSWTAFALALLVALAVPGPDLVLVVHSATRGVREAASTAVGIVSGLTLHALLAVAGATALLVSAPGALSVVQLIGAGVLLWMGASMLRTSRSAGNDDPGATGPLVRGGYAHGFVTNATNPKALLFFAAILPQFIGKGGGVGVRTAALCGAVVLGAGLWWAATIALVRLLGFHRSPVADRIITLLGGVALLVIGAGLVAGTVYTLVGPVA